ncbi:MAG: type II toxin-antitoxin system Phd/YefM family antitoxin [Deltaproteobacteria bacterium]|nr:type II toxin-antitoxin system Phd/YefM family antitoxin [Deltaproteobacteria bacterium]
MAFKLTTLKMRQQLGDILNRVHLRHDEFIIERKGKPLAAIVPVEKIEQMQHAARLYLLDVLNRKEKTSLSQSKADDLSNEAKHRSRKTKKP